MTIFNEGTHPGEFLVNQEDDSTLSRDTITIASGSGVIPAGLVLGRITKAGTASAAAFAGNAGNGVMGAVTLSAAALPGAYKLVVMEPSANAGNFTVENPNGVLVGTGAVAAAFTGGGLSFTLADGAADFAAGDGFTITVAAGSGKYKPYVDTAADGSDKAVAIAYGGVDATSADIKCVVVSRMQEVKLSALQWDAACDATAKANGLADLASISIIAR